MWMSGEGASACCVRFFDTVQSAILIIVTDILVHWLAKGTARLPPTRLHLPTRSSSEHGSSENR